MWKGKVRIDPVFAFDRLYYKFARLHLIQRIFSFLFLSIDSSSCIQVVVRLYIVNEFSTEDIFISKRKDRQK